MSLLKRIRECANKEPKDAQVGLPPPIMCFVKSCPGSHKFLPSWKKDLAFPNLLRITLLVGTAIVGLAHNPIGAIIGVGSLQARTSMNAADTTSRALIEAVPTKQQHWKEEKGKVVLALSPRLGLIPINSPPPTPVAPSMWTVRAQLPLQFPHERYILP